MNSAAEVLLTRLVGVRSNGDGWRANCPNGHSKARGSLAIAMGNDGRLLLHCFACGDVPGILGALGLSLADLYPERPRNDSAQGRAAAREAFLRSSWTAALGVLPRECRIVQIAAADVTAGRSLSDADAARLALACERIESAREVLT